MLIFNDITGVTHIVYPEKIANILFHPEATPDRLRITIHFQHAHVLTTFIDRNLMPQIISKLGLVDCQH